jgi:5-methylthioadenosine/S-adenosylhomocysteine deaminase
MTDAIPVTKSGLMLTDVTLIVDGETAPLTENALLLREGQVVDYGKSQELKQRYPGANQLSLPGHLVAPGLINSHTHASMGFFRGLAHVAAPPGTSQQTMIESFFYPAEKALTPDMIEPLAYSYLVDAIRSGVTCVADAYFYVQGVAAACDRLGMRAFVGEHIADLGGPIPAGLKHWQQTAKKIENWSFSDRIRPMVYAHAADTVSLPLLRELGDFARQHALPFHMHLSQSEGEWQRVKSRAGVSPVVYAEQAGVLGPNSLLVHLVSADRDDWQRLKDHGATAVICPISEMIYERLPDLRALIDQKIPYCLATDAPASNDGADLLREMRMFSLLLKDRGLSRSDYAAGRMLATVTSQPAQAYGLPTIGRLEPGYRADLVCFQADLGCLPMARPLETLLYSMGSRHVRHVMVDGEWVLWDRKLTKVNEDDLQSAYLSACERIHKIAGLDQISL